MGTMLTWLLAATCMGTPVGIDLVPTGVDHGVELWLTPETGGVEIIAAQVSLKWGQDIEGIGAPVSESFYGGFHGGHPWNESLDDGDALWLYLTFGETLPAEGLCIATITFPDATDPFELRLTEGLQQPSWTFGTLVAGTDIPTPQLWDGVLKTVYLPEPTTLTLLLVGGLACFRRR